MTISTFFSTTRRQASALLVALLLVGCGSTSIPVERMAVAEAAVQRANSATVRENAAAELRIAQGKLLSAQLAMNNKDYERAAQLAQEAQVDAQLAEVRAQSVQASAAAQESLESARVLRQELNR